MYVCHSRVHSFNCTHSTVGTPRQAASHRATRDHRTVTGLSMDAALRATTIVLQLEQHRSAAMPARPDVSRDVAFEPRVIGQETDHDHPIGDRLLRARPCGAGTTESRVASYKNGPVRSSIDRPRSDTSTRIGLLLVGVEDGELGVELSV